MLRSLFMKLVVAALALPLLTVACGQSGNQPTAVTPQNLFATSKPGTVMVVGDFKAHLTLPNAKVDEARVDYLKNKAIELVLAGQLPADTNAMVNWMVDQMLGDPLAYFIPTQDLREADFELLSQGSGFVISPDGYVVTNAHVAAPNEDELKRQFVATGLKNFVDQEVKDFIASQGGQASPELVHKVTQAVTTYDTKYLQVAKLDKAFYVEVGAAIPGVKVGAKDITAEVTAAGRQIPDKDVAVLKVERNNLPTVPLGDDTQVNTGDRVYVLGYPGAATFHPILSDESQVEPTMTTGTVSAKKTMPGGWTVVQIDAPITHGSSGGPVFDASGHVIGIATFGSIDPNTGKEIQGFNFAVPVSVAKEFINRAGARPQEGLVTHKYTDAIALYNKQWYSDALAEFQQVNSLSPGHPYVQDYITRSQTAVVQGKDRSNEKYIPAFAVGIPVALLLLGGGGTVLVVLLGRRSRRIAGRASQGPSGQAAAGFHGAHNGYWAQPAASAPMAPPTVTPMTAVVAQPVASTPQTAPLAPATATRAPSQPGIGFRPTTPASLSASFCSNCGNNVIGKAFCDRCGQPVRQ